MAGRLVWPMIFSVIEMCAVIVVLTQIRVSGVEAAALAFVLAGVAMAMRSEWQEIRTILGLRNRTHGSTPCAGTSSASTDSA